MESPQKLTLNQETVRNLTPEERSKTRNSLPCARGARKSGDWLYA